MPYYQKLLTGETEEQLAQADTSGADTLGEADIDRTTAHPGEIYDSARAYTPELTVSADTVREETAIGVSEEAQGARDTIPEKLVYVRTKRYDIVLSSWGGDIISMVSREFLDLNGQPMEFCPSEVAGANLPLVAFEGDRFITTESLHFVTDSDSLLLTETDPTGAVTFAAMLPDGGIIQRRYHFRYEDYAFDHATLFGGEGEKAGIDESILWWRKGLEPSDPDIKGNISANYRIGYMIGGEYDDEKFGKDEKPQFSFDGTTDFVATHNKYFVVIIAPYDGVASGVRCDGVRYSAESFGDYKRQIPALGVGLVQPGGDAPVTRHDLIYIGPRDHEILKRYNRGFEKTVNLGWSWLAPLTKLFMWGFKILYSILGNYGVVIIIFSILIKLVLLPLSRKQMKSMQRMKELEPKLSELREKYKSDVKKLNEETMKLYQKEKINPLGGCLPLIPQMPVFFALFAMLRNSFALRGAPFILWITDLSQKDPYYVLPILMGVSMFIQQKISIRDPKQKMMVYFMPLLFLFLFRNMPSGLVLYWLCFNIFSLVQTLWVEFKSEKNEALTIPSDA